jgi:hypothetical protein
MNADRYAVGSIEASGSKGAKDVCFVASHPIENLITRKSMREPALFIAGLRMSPAYLKMIDTTKLHRESVPDAI